ncbi:hypothetical protein L207DRAFT_628350 [Hyaloscypha variabilis F]|uniref:Uncharacterized protein n=1 Tax=Hyaloscypha variabilis (strain UAMH 11265 / GT02V1 / F) TaxID=1149755 RepID=A0A2J6SAG5_HYAVF|nr:hypothetical protein L207DRAFT_628350 [Hyaloscypha variabilis F]
MELIRAEDSTAKDSPNKRDTGYHEKVQPQSVEAILCINQDVTRFEQRLSAALMELVEYPTQMPYPKFKKLARNARPMGTAIFTIFNVHRASTLAALILERIPHYVQKVLGKIQPTFDDLLQMPEPKPDQTKCWIVYFDGTVRWEILGSPKIVTKPIE